MEKIEIDPQDVVETPEEEQTLETPETEAPTSQEQAQDVDWEAKYKELEDKNKKLYARLKDEERKAPPKKEEKVPSQQETALSFKDSYALVKADVAEEDIDDVVDYARLKGVSVADALKSSVIRTILDEKKEQRATAQATSTKSASRGSAKLSDETLVSNAEKGIMPDNDEDMARLVRLRYTKKK